MGMSSLIAKVPKAAHTGKMGVEESQVMRTITIHKWKEIFMNSKANKFRKGQQHYRNEVQYQKAAVLTLAQKRALSEQLAAQVAEHVANGGEVKVVAAGATLVADGCSPMRHLTTAQKRARSST